MTWTVRTSKMQEYHRDLKIWLFATCCLHPAKTLILPPLALADSEIAALVLLKPA